MKPDKFTQTNVYLYLLDFNDALFNLSIDSDKPIKIKKVRNYQCWWRKKLNLKMKNYPEELKSEYETLEKDVASKVI